jgi:hypothetical protein
MKTPVRTTNSDAVLRALAAKLRLKRLKIERLRGAVRLLESECERLEGEIRNRIS